MEITEREREEIVASIYEMKDALKGIVVDQTALLDRLREILEEEDEYYECRNC